MRARFPQFRTQTAIVTGAASGIGRLKVERLRTAGVHVVGGDLNPQIESIRKDDQGFIGMVGDVTDPDYTRSLVKTAHERFGPVDLLFHSAGIMPGGSIADIAAEAILQVMCTNYAGTIHTVKAVLPSMREQGHGRIVVLGSLTGYVPSQCFASYSASKAAVNTFTETLAHEEARNGIQVLLAAPIAVKTPLLFQATGGPTFVTSLTNRDKSPLMITPDKVLDDIEKGLQRGRTVVTPGGLGPYIARRISPAATWRLIAILGG